MLSDCKAGGKEMTDGVLIAAEENSRAKDGLFNNL